MSHVHAERGIDDDNTKHSHYFFSVDVQMPRNRCTYRLNCP